MIVIFLTIITILVTIIIVKQLNLKDAYETIDYWKKLNLMKSDMITEYFSEMKKLEIELRDLKENNIFVKRKKGVNQE